MRPKLVFKCTICDTECKNLSAHFWRYHYQQKRQEVFDSPNMMQDILNKYFVGVTIQK